MEVERRISKMGDIIPGDRFVGNTITFFAWTWNPPDQKYNQFSSFFINFKNWFGLYPMAQTDIQTDRLVTDMGTLFFWRGVSGLVVLVLIFFCHASNLFVRLKEAPKHIVHYKLYIPHLFKAI